jgi:hypothetical protein
VRKGCIVLREALPHGWASVPVVNRHSFGLSLLLLAVGCSVRSRIEIYYFGDVGKSNFDDLAVCTFHLDARGRQSLGGFHATDNAADALSVSGDDLDVVFSV